MQITYIGLEKKSVLVMLLNFRNKYIAIEFFDRW